MQSCKILHTRRKNFTKIQYLTMRGSPRHTFTLLYCYNYRMNNCEICEILPKLEEPFIIHEGDHWVANGTVLFSQG
jgi:hypothetical protein